MNTLSSRLKDFVKSDYFSLSSREFKIIFIGTTIGLLAQILCQRYIKAHPELFAKETEKIEKVEPETKFRNRRLFLPRGGAFPAAVPIILKVIEILAQHGLLSSTVIGIGKVLYDKTNRKALIVYLGEASASYWIKKSTRVIGNETGKDIFKNTCPSNKDLQYLVQILNNSEVSLEEKQRLIKEIFATYFNDTKYQKEAALIAFLICLLFILGLMYSTNIANYHLLLANLLQALREGKVSKPLVRLVIRNLKKKGVLVDPTLINEVEGSYWLMNEVEAPLIKI